MLMLRDRLRMFKIMPSSTPFLRYVAYKILTVAKMQTSGDEKNQVCLGFFSQASGAAHGVWKMTFFTPEPVTMVLREAEQAGYATMTTSSRLVMRSPYNTAETYSEDVSNHTTSFFFVHLLSASL